MTAELEPVAWAYSFKERSPVLTDEKKDWAVGSSKWTEEPLVTLSSAQEAIDKREERIRELEAAIDQHENKLTESEDGDLWRFWRMKSDAAIARVKELEAALDEKEIASGLTRDGNLWRFWSAKAKDVATKLSAAEARASALQALLDEVGEVVEENWLGEYWSSVNGTMARRVSAITAKIKEAKG